ncbi:MAG: LPS-assembly protein LptD [Paracoccaceae bacterium]
MRLVRALTCLFLFLAGTVPAGAQTAALLADNVQILSETKIVASGNVEVISGAVRLKASQITFDAALGTLEIVGPITLTQGENVVIFATSAELDQSLENGIMRDARLVLNRQLQLAATEISRVSGRYTQLYQTVTTSCRICAVNPTPLWRIRAEKVVHDQQERLIYFENAVLLIGDVPVFFLPRLRLPDPTLKRARGFLVPSFQASSQLGFGVRIPYFIPLGNSADITLAPRISARSNTLETRYRQAFATGRLQFDAAVTRDMLLPDQTRAYFFGRGEFLLGRELNLNFDIETTSDPAYLLDYGYSSKDRLDSEVSLSRTGENSYFSARVTNFRTLRGSELAIDDQLPNFQGEISYQKRFFPKSIGGQGIWALGIEAHSRQSQLDELGRDVLRLSGELNWGRGIALQNGMVARAAVELTANAYQIAQDSNYQPFLLTFTPAAEAELRWPLVKSARDGAALVLEPVLHVAWTGSLGQNVPNEDSTLVEFDEGNLFSINRFPGEDRYERGFRTTAGVKWTRYDPQGWSLGLAAGRVFRARDLMQFSQASGLDGPQSDWMLAGQIKLDNALAVTARALVADDLSITKAETRISRQTERLSLASTYSWIVADLAETRPDLTSQMALDATYAISRYWSTRVDLRYDFEAGKATRAGVAVAYNSGCVTVDLSLSRRFTSSTSVTPSTDVGFSVSLNGFGGSGRTDRRECSQ